MIRALLERSQTGDDGTAGVLTGDTDFGCVTLELPRRNNEPHISCIPANIYVCKYQQSPSDRKWHYYLQNVPGRSGVRFDIGNWAGDVTKINPKTGLHYRCDVLACILVGTRHSNLADQRAVLDSERMMARLLQHFGPEDWEIEIRWVNEQHLDT